jgi:hypothetical protein
VQPGSSRSQMQKSSSGKFHRGPLASLDHLVGAREHGCRDLKAEAREPESISTAAGYGLWPSPLPRLGRNDQLSGLSRENRPELQSAGAGYRVEVKTTGARSSWPDVKPAETITTSPFR